MFRRTSVLIQGIGAALFSPRQAQPGGSSAGELKEVANFDAKGSILEKPGAVFWLLLGMLPVFLLLAAIVPPFDDEFYYWCWSQDLQWSYYDHPPMVAYMIRLSTLVFGHSIVAIRIPCVIAGLVVIGVVTSLSRPRDLIPYVILSPVPTFATVMVTPDTPMLLFWSLYLAWLVFIHKRLSLSEVSAHSELRACHWLLGGVILGCGVLGKYTTGLAAVSGFLTFVAAGTWRRWISGYVLHGLVALLVASPILIHNIKHDFVPIRYQWEHSMSSPEPGFSPFIEFVGVQLLLFGTAPFVVFAWALINLRRLRTDPKLRVCAGLFLFPLGFFLYKSTRGHLQGNWAFPCFLAGWPLAAVLYAQWKQYRLWRVSTALAFAVPLGASVVFAIHSIVPIPFIPVEIDRATRQWDKLEMVRAVAQDLHKTGYTGPVYAGTYQWVSLLRWYGVDARQMEEVSRPSHFTERANPPVDKRQYVLFLESSNPSPEAECGKFGKFRVLTTHQLIIRGVPGPFFHILDFSDPPVLESLGRDKNTLDSTPVVGMVPAFGSGNRSAVGEGQGLPGRP